MAHQNSYIVGGWTEDQDAILRREIAAGKTYDQVGKMLWRSRCSVGARAHRLGIKSPARPNMVRQPLAKVGLRINRDKLNAFAEALAETGTIAGATRLLGVSSQRGSQLLGVIRAEIDGPQLAAGYGRWAV